MTRSLHDALDETIAFIERALGRIRADEGAEAELHNLRAYLVNVLDLVERDPGIEAASDDPYAVARRVAEGSDKGPRMRRLLVKLLSASLIATLLRITSAYRVSQRTAERTSAKPEARFLIAQAGCIPTPISSNATPSPPSAWRPPGSQAVFHLPNRTRSSVDSPALLRSERRLGMLLMRIICPCGT